MENVSVIVPVYNVEKYLARCVESICNQTYEALEILLIDDGSSDGCPALCDEYGNRDARIRVIHQENVGAGGARNRGLMEAAGEYVFYVDADDWIAENCIETYVSAIKENDVDLIASNHYCVVSKDSMTDCYSLPAGLYAGEDKKGLLLAEGFVSMWTKLFRREWLVKHKLFQPDLCTYEDWGAYANIICSAQKICVINHPGHFYTLARQGSTSTGSELRWILNFEKTIPYILRFMRDNCLWVAMKERLRYFCLKDYYFRRRINNKSQDQKAREALERIKTNILIEEFGDFQLEDKNYLILGSFSLRWEVQKASLVGEKTDRHFCFSSITSIFSREWECGVTHENIFRQRQIEWEMRGELVKQIVNADGHTMFFLDFMEERFDLLEIEPGIFMTESDAFCGSSLKNRKYIRKIANDSSEYLELWQKACDELAALLKRYMKPEQIILVKNRMSVKYGDFVKTESFENVTEIRRINQRMEYMEQYFCRLMPGVMIIELEQESLFADPNLPYGCRPEYANNACYAKAAFEIFNILR